MSAVTNLYVLAFSCFEVVDEWRSCFRELNDNVITAIDSNAFATLTSLESLFVLYPVIESCLHQLFRWVDLCITTTSPRSSHRSLRATSCWAICLYLCRIGMCCIRMCDDVHLGTWITIALTASTISPSATTHFWPPCLMTRMLRFTAPRWFDRMICTWSILEITWDVWWS